MRSECANRHFEYGGVRDRQPRAGLAADVDRLEVIAHGRRVSVLRSAPGLLEPMRWIDNAVLAAERPFGAVGVDRADMPLAAWARIGIGLENPGVVPAPPGTELASVGESLEDARWRLATRGRLGGCVHGVRFSDWRDRST